MEIGLELKNTTILLQVNFYQFRGCVSTGVAYLRSQEIVLPEGTSQHAGRRRNATERAALLALTLLTALMVLYEHSVAAEQRRLCDVPHWIPVIGASQAAAGNGRRGTR